MKKITLLLTLIFVVCSCKNDQLEELQEQNREQQERINQLENQKEEIEIEPESTTQFCFTVLEVTENWSGEIKNYIITSDINEIDGIINTKRYRILDEVVSTYKNTPSARTFNGSVLSRELYCYDSYDEASISREKYIMVN